MKSLDTELGEDESIIGSFELVPGTVDHRTSVDSSLASPGERYLF